MDWEVSRPREMGNWQRRRQLGEEPIYCAAYDEQEEILCAGSALQLDASARTTQRLRYEDHGLRFLKGQRPRLLSASLRGPFSKESGWQNPWLPKSPPPITEPDTITNLPPRTEEKPETGVQDTAAMEETTMCHLPSPDSYRDLQLSESAHLDSERLSRINQWRSSISTHSLQREGFWASEGGSSELFDANSNAKRPAGHHWLKSRNSKRRKSHLDGSGSPTPALSVESAPLSTSKGGRNRNEQKNDHISQARNMNNSLEIATPSSMAEKTTSRRMRSVPFLEESTETSEDERLSINTPVQPNATRDVSAGFNHLLIPTGEDTSSQETGITPKLGTVSPASLSGLIQNNNQVTTVKMDCRSAAPRRDEHARCNDQMLDNHKHSIGEMEVENEMSEDSDDDTDPSFANCSDESFRFRVRPVRHNALSPDGNIFVANENRLSRPTQAEESNMVQPQAALAEVDFTKMTAPRDEHVSDSLVREQHRLPKPGPEGSVLDAASCRPQMTSIPTETPRETSTSLEQTEPFLLVSKKVDMGQAVSFREINKSNDDGTVVSFNNGAALPIASFDGANDMIEQHESPTQEHTPRRHASAQLLGRDRGSALDSEIVDANSGIALTTNDGLLRVEEDDKPWSDCAANLVLKDMTPSPISITHLANQTVSVSQIDTPTRQALADTRDITEQLEHDSDARNLYSQIESDRTAISTSPTPHENGATEVFDAPSIKLERTIEDVEHLPHTIVLESAEAESNSYSEVGREQVKSEPLEENHWVPASRAISLLTSPVSLNQDSWVRPSQQSPWIGTAVPPVGECTSISSLAIDPQDVDCNVVRAQESEISANIATRSATKTPAKTVRTESTPDPDLSIKTFATFNTPSPKNKRGVPHLRFSGRRLPSTPSLKSATRENPWIGARSNSNRRVSFAPLPDDRTETDLEDNPRHRAVKESSPPPQSSTEADYEDLGGRFRQHFDVVRRRTAGEPPARLPLHLPTRAHDQTPSSPEVSAMAEAFRAADAQHFANNVHRSVLAREIDAVEIANDDTQTPWRAESQGADDVAAVLQNLDDFLNPRWDVEAEMDKVTVAQGVENQRAKHSLEARILETSVWDFE
ncbi:hypothetical protein BX600DRAFT_136999 [Xylariales sp. PMI_506]|nr:hypothetical protein BX600DRAFT_136999 [Xylariales sp. PMI_506]